MAIRKKLNPTVEIPMTVDEINEYRAMLDKAKPKAVVPFKITPTDTKNLYKCPSCNRTIFKDENYCPGCGQCLDQEN